MGKVKKPASIKSVYKFTQGRKANRIKYLREYREDPLYKLQREVWLERHPDYYKKWLQKNPNYYKKYRTKTRVRYYIYQMQWRMRNRERKKLYMRYYMRKYRRLRR